MSLNDVESFIPPSLRPLTGRSKKNGGQGVTIPNGVSRSLIRLQVHRRVGSIGGPFDLGDSQVDVSYGNDSIGDLGLVPECGSPPTLLLCSPR